MKQVEYTTVSNIQGIKKPEDLKVIFNAMGKRGWKHTGNYGELIIFMRETEKEAEPEDRR
jgi:hypothetical protein